MLPSQPHCRLYAALTVSAVLHVTLLGAGEFVRFHSPWPEPVAPSVLQARLPPPAEASPLLKNTLSDDAGQHLGLAQAAVPRTSRESLRPPSQRHAQRKLADHLFYPPEAIARGLEGEVRLLLTLDQDGGVLDAQVASSSGHDLLDQAAVAAAQAMRRVPNAGVRELILPVEFRLQ